MKNIKKTMIILFIISLCMPLISYAFSPSINSNQEKMGFFSVEKDKASPGDTISMYINLDNIEYEKYIFTLSSNTSLSGINSEDIETNINENVLTIEGNTQESLLRKIELYYQIPENIEIGTIIELKAKIQQKLESVNQDETIQNEDEETNSSIEQEINDNQNNAEEITIYISIVEAYDNTEKIEDNQEIEKEQNLNIKNPNEYVENNSYQENNSIQINQLNMQNNTVQTEFSQIAGTTNNVATNQSETYQGESNNYLSSLSINEYTLNSDFVKTNMTYFLTVENDVTNLDILAIPEDENAKINIYGNKNLQEGTNKILISVTAENGDVKTYRIYVSKNS